MRDLKACIVCFTMDVRLFSMDKNQLGQQYSLLTGLQIMKGNGMPDYLCYQCSGYVTKFIKFRDKCHRAYFVLDQLLQKNNKIKKANLEALEDCDSIGIKSDLSYLNINKAYYKQLKFKWIEYKPTNTDESMNLIPDVIPIVTYTTLTEEQMFEDIPNGNLIKDDYNSVKEEVMDMVEINVNVPMNISYNDEEMNAQSSRYNAEDTHVFDDNNDNYFDSDGNDNSSCVLKQSTIQQHNTTSKQRNIKKKKKKQNNNSSSLAKPLKKQQDADGSALETEYATMHAISKNEAQAALKISKMCGLGKFKCNVCEKRYKHEVDLKTHLRRHDVHMSGSHLCELCNYYYKTSFLLKTHMTEKHMYKYVCTKCPEVSFEQSLAKQHYVSAHLRKHCTTGEEWELVRPSWLIQNGPKKDKSSRKREERKKKRKKKSDKLPDDFLVYTPISQEEQYSIIQERKTTRNYIDAPFKCDLCFRGFREQITYSKHMKSHDPTISGNRQCDMCKIYVKDYKKMYAHMVNSHLRKYSCQLCSFVCYSRGRALIHYRLHKNVTYKCPHCPLEFKKIQTRLTHVRMKHPSSFLCNLCGHSFVSENGLNFHKHKSHTAEEKEASFQAPVDKNSPLYCADCDVLFLNEAAFENHLGSSKNHAKDNESVKKYFRSRGARVYKTYRRGKPRRPRKSPAASEVLNAGVALSTTCEICSKVLANDVQARKHYAAEHPGREFPEKRYMCDVCGYTSKQHANLLLHMRTHSNEKPFSCHVCDRRFTQQSSRDRHMLIHTGEMKFQCNRCQRRFRQKITLKLHIQTVHLKIPYAPWDKKNRKRRQELEATPVPSVKIDPQPYLNYQNAYLHSYNDEY